MNFNWLNITQADPSASNSSLQTGLRNGFLSRADYAKEGHVTESAGF
jgi:hypothetical protein